MSSGKTSLKLEISCAEAGGIGPWVMELDGGGDSDGDGTMEPCLVVTKPEGAESRAEVTSERSSGVSTETGGASSECGGGLSWMGISYLTGPLWMVILRSCHQISGSKNRKNG